MADIAEKWLRGPLLVAGDAAHQTPPFMGQGMCARIRDVFNLGWKLDCVFKGHASEDLLETYEIERKPHVKAFIDLTVKMGHLINTTASSLVLRTVSTAADEPQKLTQLRPTLGVGLSACRTE
jgi:3-(3-hydroxy-phenyl)propionate hydroxylase